MSTGIDASLLAKQATDTSELYRFKQEMDGLKSRLSGKTESKEAGLREACQKFEAVFISKLWQGMKSTVQKEGYLHSKQEEQYNSMFDREFAENMARAGGIGLADMIYDQLSQKLKDTSRTALSGGVEIKPLNNEPIPLKTSTPIALNPKKEMTLEEWGGAASHAAPISGGAATVAAVESVQAEKAAPASTIRQSAPPASSDAEVQSQLDELARRLEAQRMKAQLLGSSPTGSGQAYDNESDEQVGRKLAEIG